MTTHRLPQMTGAESRRLRWCLLPLVLMGLALTPGLHADERDVLRSLLDEFLQRVDDPAMHERFWDDALIYTSSNGTRFGKAAILAGMEERRNVGDAPIVKYWAEETQVMLFGDTAVVAFVLRSEVVPEPGGEAPPRSRNLNTGTFRRQDGAWRVVAWQSTRVPEGDEP